jgi:hypothetical protein
MNRYKLIIHFHNEFSSTGWTNGRVASIYESFKTLKEIEPYKELIDHTCKQTVIVDNVNGKIIKLK